MVQFPISIQDKGLHNVVVQATVKQLGKLPVVSSSTAKLVVVVVVFSFILTSPDAT